jgi:hypothetical protein
MPDPSAPERQPKAFTIKTIMFHDKLVMARAPEGAARMATMPLIMLRKHPTPPRSSGKFTNPCNPDFPYRILNFLCINHRRYQHPEDPMKTFVASVDYASKLADGTRHYAQPFFFTAANALEAGKIVRAIADFAALTIAPDVHVQYAEKGGPAMELQRSSSH